MCNITVVHVAPSSRLFCIYNDFCNCFILQLLKTQLKVQNLYTPSHFPKCLCKANSGSQALCLTPLLLKRSVYIRYQSYTHVQCFSTNNNSKLHSNQPFLRIPYPVFLKIILLYIFCSSPHFKCCLMASQTWVGPSVRSLCVLPVFPRIFSDYC